MEIDIQKMVEDYNSILKENYNGYNSERFSDNFEKFKERYNNNVEKFKERYGAIEDEYWFEENGAKTKFLSIKQGDKEIILPSFLDTYFSNIPEFAEKNEMIDTMFESGHKQGDNLKEIELNMPAILDIDKNDVPIRTNRINKGKLTLHNIGSYYFKGDNATTSPSETPSAKPEPPSETPANTEEAYRRLNEEAAKKSRKQAENTEKYVVGNLRAQEIGKQQSAEIEGNMKKIREEKKTKEAQKSELKNNIGPDNEKGYVSSAVGGTSRSWRKNHTNEENRFIDARRYYAKNIDTIEQQKSRIIAAKDSFLKNYDESMISDESMGKMKAAFEEAKSEHNQSILEAKRAGRSAPLLNDAKVNSQINSQIAQKVFGKAEDAELAAVDYMRKKNNAEGIIARAENRNSVLSKYIDSAQEKGENKIARGAKAGGLGWKGKAAIFGGVALGALSLVGVASMVMSGGRQQNSNLYNPYQAMY